jgi:hypothetical protein
MCARSLGHCKAARVSETVVLRVDSRILTGPCLDLPCDAKPIPGKVSPLTALHCAYFLSDKPVEVRVSQLADGRKDCRFRIEVSDAAIGRQTRPRAPVPKPKHTPLPTVSI